MNRNDLKAIALSLGLLINTVCLVYYMPGLSGLLVCFFLLCCASVVTSE